MARKSRKQINRTNQTNLTATAATPQKIPTAAYCRLSVENGGKGEEETLETQTRLVHDFIDKHSELELTGTYVDNGFSGTNFERPAFLRMVEDARQGKIRCVVVKDLSRFGRNYLESGYYIETIFPFLGVRLMAVTDGFDSNRKEDMEGLSTPIRNLANDLYAKDISQKTWSANQALKKSGRSCGNCAPYGYVRVDGHNEIDWKTAHYVQMIFQWFLLGHSYGEIARRLDLLGAPTPRTRAHELGFAKNPEGATWKPQSVRLILGNRAYIGDTVTNKTNQAYFKGQKRSLLPKSEWIVTEGTHEPLIARDDYKAVERLLKEKADKRRAWLDEAPETDDTDNLKGIIFCAECGKKMLFDRLPHKRAAADRTAYYICQGSGICRGHKLTADVVKKQAMDCIRSYMIAFCDREKILRAIMGRGGYQPLKDAQAAVKESEKKERQTAEKKQTLYEDFALGMLGADEYIYINRKYSKQQEAAIQELENAKKELDEIEKDWKRFSDWAERWRSADCTAFDEDIVNEMVERIRIHDDGALEIDFRFSDMIRKFAGLDGMAESREE